MYWFRVYNSGLGVDGIVTLYGPQQYSGLQFSSVPTPLLATTLEDVGWLGSVFRSCLTALVIIRILLAVVMIWSIRKPVLLLQAPYAT